MSTTEVEILGDGAFAGSKTNIADFSVREYGSPLSMTDLSGGVASIDFSVLEDVGFDGSFLLPGQPFELRDPHAGTQRGIIDNGGSSDGYTLSLAANGVLYKLVSQREAPAFSGTLGQAIISYFALCGIESGFQIDPEVAAIQVNLPRWVGDVWTQIKKLMAIHQFEIAEVAGSIVVRKLRLREVDVQRYQSVRLNYGRTQASQIVEVHHYNNEWKVDSQVYPEVDSDLPDRSIISVEASETSVTNYPVNMWVTEIDPPEQVSSVSPETNNQTNSIYSVVDKDGRPVSVTNWRNGGGLVEFAIGEDGRSIDVTVRGMAAQRQAPYRIASSSADREYQYSSLFIVATGVAFRDEMVWSATGEDLRDAPADAVTVIEDPMISTREEALMVLSHAVRKESGFSQALEVSTTAVNRRGETGQRLYPTFSEFDSRFGDLTFEQFGLNFEGMTFGDFMEYQAAEHADDFANQAMGGVGGARVRHRDNIYRITDATSGPGGFTWSAEPDMLFSEWDELSEDAPLTFGDFDGKWAGKTFEQHARMPLSAGRGTWVEAARNYFPNPQPSVYDSAYYESWAGTSNTSLSVFGEDVDWALSGRALTVEYVTVTTPASGDVGPRPAVAPGRTFIPIDEVWTIAYTIMTNTPGYITAPTNSSITRLATSGDIPDAVPGQPYRVWSTFRRSNSSAWPSNVRISVTHRNKAVGTRLSVADVDLYPGEHQPDREFFYGGGEATESIRYRWAGQVNASASIMEKLAPPPRPL